MQRPDVGIITVFSRGLGFYHQKAQNFSFITDFITLFLTRELVRKHSDQGLFSRFSPGFFHDNQDSHPSAPLKGG
jgi:hypothetical protein